MSGINPKEWTLEAHKNACGGKSAGRQWCLFLKEKLESIGFKRSEVDECAFCKGTCMCVLCTDDSILVGLDKDELDSVLKHIEGTKLGITEEWDASDFLGVNITKKGDSFHLTQPRLIQSILEELHLDGDNVQTKDTPMKSSQLLKRHLQSPEFGDSFNMRRVVGKLNFLEASTRGDISHATHQIARFVSDPRREHGEAARWLGRHLASTKLQGMVLTPDPTRGLEVWADASFAGDLDPGGAGVDMDTARSRHGFTILCAGVPLLHKSQLQGDIALSSAEAELIGLSSSLCKSIPTLSILKEMKELGFDTLSQGPEIHCRAFQDNNAVLTMVQFPKMRPRTKHINTKH